MKKVDRVWFLKTIKASPYGSLRQVARRLIQPNGEPTDPAALSKKISGKVKLTLYELRELSTLLNVSVLEALQRAGLEIFDSDWKNYR